MNPPAPTGDATPIEAIIFDWAGTTVDHGCMVPVAAFREVFRRRGVAVSTATTRGPMGTHKRAHIERLCAVPEVAAAWHARFGRVPDAADVDAMFADFIPLQLAVLRDHADPVPGCLAAVAALRSRGLGPRRPAPRSEGPPQHKLSRRTPTLLGLSNSAPPPPPVSRSPRPEPAPHPPAAPLPRPAPASRSPQPEPPPRSRSAPRAVYGALPPFVLPPPRPSAAVAPLAPVERSAADPADFDDPDEQTRVGAVLTAAQVVPVEPSAASAADFDDPTDATIVSERPTAAQLGLPELDVHGVVVGRVTARTLPSMPSLALSSVRPAPRIDVVGAGATNGAEVAPPPGAAVGKPDAPPSTKPSTSCRIPIPGASRSSLRPVSFDEQIRRALARVEDQVHVPPELETRWLARLHALRETLNLGESAEPTDEHVEAMIRELYHAEADAKDVRLLEETLPSAASLIAQRIATATRAPDAEGEATLLRGGTRTDEDPDDAGRETGEEFTKVYSRHPDEADAQIPGLQVALKPATVRPPHPPPPKLGDARTAPGRRPTLFGGIGLAAARGPAPHPAPGDQQTGAEEASAEP